MIFDFVKFTAWALVQNWDIFMGLQIVFAFGSHGE